VDPFKAGQTEGRKSDEPPYTPESGTVFVRQLPEFSYVTSVVVPWAQPFHPESNIVFGTCAESPGASYCSNEENIRANKIDHC
jgi:hypothetical protein